MTLTPEKLDELERLAELVTPGPWELKDGRTDTIENAQGYPVCTVHYHPYELYGHGVRAAYIASLDPATVRELVRLARIGERHETRPDPLGDAMNSGDGVYRP